MADGAVNMVVEAMDMCVDAMVVAVTEIIIMIDAQCQDKKSPIIM